MGCCSASNCCNKTSAGYRLFRFPSDICRRAIWLQNCQRDNWNPTSTARLCEVHFEKSQWEDHRKDGWKKLKPNAIPTLFDVPNPPRKLASTKKSQYKCHFESSMFTQSKEGRRNLKINAVPSVPTPKSRNTQIQKVTKETPNKNANKEEKASQLQLVPAPPNSRNKRKNSGCFEEPPPGTKRRRTIPAKLRNSSDECSPIPVTEKLNKSSESEGPSSAQKVGARVPKRTQIQGEKTPSAPKEVTRVPKNVQHEVPPIEKTKVAKAPDKEVSQETATTTKDTTRKSWCKLDEICRLCIRKCNRPTNVYESDLAFKIEAISSIREMSPTDGLPVNVCQDCKDMTNIFYSFKLQCEAADETLKSCLKVLQEEDGNEIVVKQQTVAKPLFPELFKFSAVSSDESDIEEVDSEMEEEAALQALRVVQTAPAIPAVPLVQTSPIEPAVPVVQTVPAVPIVLPAVQTAPAVPVVQTAVPSTSTVRRRKRSPPSMSLQDELDKAWTEFSHNETNLLPVRKSTATSRKENKPQHTEVKGVEKRRPVPKSVSSPKPSAIACSPSQNELDLRKEQLQKESTPFQVYKPQLIERQTKPLQGKEQLIKYLGTNVEVIQQKSPKGTMGNVMGTMVNNPKKAYNTKVDQRNTDSVNLQQKTSVVSAENKADKQNSSGENATTKGTAFGSDSLYEVKRPAPKASEIRKLGPTMSAYKVGALGKNVEIYRIPGQKPKPLLSKAVAVENKTTTSKTEDLPLKKTQAQERTPKIQESNGRHVQTSKPENSQLCHIEIFKVQNHGDRKLCLTALEGTDVSLRPMSQLPNTKLVAFANKLEQNLQPVVKSNTKSHIRSTDDSAATTGKLEQNFQHNKDQDNVPNAGKLEQNLRPICTSGSQMDVQDGKSNASKGKLDQNLPAMVTTNIKDNVSDDSAANTRDLVPVSDPKMHIQDGNSDAAEKLAQNLQSELSSDAKVHEEDNDRSLATEKMLETELSSDNKMHENNSDDGTATTGELVQNSQPVLTSDAQVHVQNVNNTTPTSEKSVKTYPRPCKSISLPSPPLTTGITKKVEETVENLEPKEHVDVAKNNTEDEYQKKTELQEQEGCADMAKTVEVEKDSDITQNIVEELLNGAAMFADSDSVEPELPLSLGEPEGKVPDETEQLGDILGSRDETELPQDISKLIEQSEEAAYSEKSQDKKEAHKTSDAINEEQSKAEELEAVEETLKLKNGEECTQDTSGGGAVVQDSDEKLADCKQGLNGTDDDRQCHICAKYFPLSALQRHIASHWSQKDLLCEKCGISFFFPADLERHVISHGPQELTSNREDTPTVRQQLRVSRQRTFTCGACGMDFTNWFQLRDHKLIHKKGRRHRCGSCSKHFRTKYILQNHMWVHTMLKKPSCELCGKTFSLPWYVDRHIAEEHS